MNSFNDLFSEFNSAKYYIAIMIKRTAKKKVEFNFERLIKHLQG